MRPGLLLASELRAYSSLGYSLTNPCHPALPSAALPQKEAAWLVLDPSLPAGLDEGVWVDHSGLGNNLTLFSGVRPSPQFGGVLTFSGTAEGYAHRASALAKGSLEGLPWSGGRLRPACPGSACHAYCPYGTAVVHVAVPNAQSAAKAQRLPAAPMHACLLPLCAAHCAATADCSLLPGPLHI